MHASQPHVERAEQSRVLVVNPFAGNVRRAAIARVVERVGLDGNAVLEIGKDGTARELAARLVRDGVPRVLVAGGDGTWHHVIQVLAGTTTALGVIPLGTSNDLAQRLGIPRRLDHALDTLAGADVARVDLVKMGDARVATVGGFGVAAHVAAACGRLKAHPWLRPAARALGPMIYSVAAAWRIARRGAQATPCLTRTDHGPSVRERVSAILVGVVARFGGGLQLAADGEPTPGTFCALVVTAATRAALFDTLFRLRAGRSCPNRVRRYSGLTRFRWESDTLLGSFADGEWLGPRHKAVIELERGALRALVPAPHMVTATREAS